MKQIRVFFNKNNGADQAQVDRLRELDWLDQVDFTTDDPPPVPIRHRGWLVQDVESGKVYHGALAWRMIYFRMPARIPLALLMLIPFIATYVARCRH